MLMKVVREYQPATEVADLVHRERADDATREIEALPAAGRVTELASRRLM
jgi:hypothetical protein